MEPRLISGGRFVDDRGTLSVVNEFDLAGVNRFYIVENHRDGFVRAWHGHQREAKYVMVVSGAAIVAAVAVDDWDSPSPDLPIHRFVLSADSPAILHVPAGYANGFKTLRPDTRIIFFSTATLEESATDDIRFEAHFWNPWDVVER